RWRPETRARTSVATRRSSALATAPRTGRETSTPPRGAGNRAQLSSAQHWTGYVTLSGARGTAHTPNDRWGPAPHRERNPTHQADGSHTVRNANTTLCPPNPNESFSAARSEEHTS